MIQSVKENNINCIERDIMKTGIVFIILGLLIIGKENLNMEEIDNERVFSIKKNLKKDNNYKYKNLIGLFSLVLGLFRILNKIIY